MSMTIQKASKIKTEKSLFYYFHLCEIAQLFDTQHQARLMGWVKQERQRKNERHTIKYYFQSLWHSEMNVKMFTVRRINWKWIKPAEEADERDLCCVFFCFRVKEGRENETLFCCALMLCVTRGDEWMNGYDGGWENWRRFQASVLNGVKFPSLPVHNCSLFGWLLYESCLRWFNMQFLGGIAKCD